MADVVQQTDVSIVSMAAQAVPRQDAPHPRDPPRPGVLRRLFPKLTDEQATVLASVRFPCC